MNEPMHHNNHALFIERIVELVSLDEFKQTAFYFVNKTAESILLFARTLYKASNTLDKKDFRTLLDSVGFTEGSPTTSKYLHIGKEYTSLCLIQDNLPNNWTTIYKIACLSSDERHDLVEAGKITPLTIGNSEIFDCLKKPHTLQRQKITAQIKALFDPDAPCLVIRFNYIDKSKKKDLDSVIEAVTEKFDVNVDFTPPLTQALNNARALRSDQSRPTT